MKDMALSTKLDYLRGRIAIMYEKGVDAKELGDIALELLIRRNEVEHRLDENPTSEIKKEIRQTLDALRELEKAIISVYMLNRLSGKKEFQSPYLDYMSRRYSIYRKAEQP